MAADDSAAGRERAVGADLVRPTGCIRSVILRPRLLERVQPYNMHSYCWLPLTTARRRLGALVFTSKQPATYDRADVPLLQLVAFLLVPLDILVRRLS